MWYSMSIQLIEAKAATKSKNRVGYPMLSHISTQAMEMEMP
jgi:hypothetical protein